MAVIAFQPGPGAYVVAFWCDDAAEFDRYAELVLSGRFTFDGQHVDREVDDASDREALFIRLRLAAPYRQPSPRLRFEDVEAAQRIIAVGFYAFEGGLYLATAGDLPGVVVLDRVYHTMPPSQYHGRTTPSDAVGAQQTCRG